MIALITGGLAFQECVFDTRYLETSFPDKGALAVQESSVGYWDIKEYIYKLY